MRNGFLRFASVMLAVAFTVGLCPILSGCETKIIPEEHITQTDRKYTVLSPDKSLAFTLDTSGGMSYTLARLEKKESKEWIKESDMGVTVGDTHFFENATVEEIRVRYDEISIPIYGNVSTAEGKYIEAVFQLSQQGIYKLQDYRLEIRVYDNGVAFRYCFPDTEDEGTLTEHTEYSLCDEVTECWYGVENQDYEAEIEKHKPEKASDDRITAPLTAVIGDDEGYISIMEAGLNETYPGVNLKAEGNGVYSTCFYTIPEMPEGDRTTAWRLINVADTLNDLVNNYNVYTVVGGADEKLYKDTSWIVTGRSTWSWCTEDQAPTPENMREFTLAAAKLGYEYNIIDDGWPSWENYKSELKTLGKLGESNNVRQILWGGITLGSDGYNKMPTEEKVDEFFKLLKDTHIYGGKIDFWWSEARSATTALQRYILEEAARENLVINFHGCNKNTGLNARYPNELTREGVRGIEQFGMSEWANNAEYARWLNAQLYTRYLCGHADWTPATYSAMQIASLICIDSPLMVVSTHPDDILSSPAVEFIKSIPTTWDQTVVLSDSKIGRYSAYAKEKDGVWFVGGISSSLRRGVKVDLSEFLPNDGTYTAEIWTGNTGELKKQVITVSSRDEIELGGVGTGYGYAIRLTKLELSQYGGEIKGDITVKAPAFATVKYTTDGTDPLVSDTAVKCKNNTISLDKSCRLTVAIVSGSGKGTKISYQFNKIREQ